MGRFLPTHPALAHTLAGFFNQQGLENAKGSEAALKLLAWQDIKDSKSVLIFVPNVYSIMQPSTASMCVCFKHSLWCVAYQIANLNHIYARLQ